jgi:hypothetical protein
MPSLAFASGVLQEIRCLFPLRAENKAPIEFVVTEANSPWQSAEIIFLTEHQATSSSAANQRLLWEYGKYGDVVLIEGVPAGLPYNPLVMEKESNYFRRYLGGLPSAERFTIVGWDDPYALTASQGLIPLFSDVSFDIGQRVRGLVDNLNGQRDHALLATLAQQIPKIRETQMRIWILGINFPNKIIAQLSGFGWRYSSLQIREFGAPTDFQNLRSRPLHVTGD